MRGGQPAYADAIKNATGTRGIDDRKMLLEKLLVLMSRLPETSQFASQLEVLVIDVCESFSYACFPQCALDACLSLLLLLFHPLGRSCCSIFNHRSLSLLPYSCLHIICGGAMLDCIAPFTASAFNIIVTHSNPAIQSKLHIIRWSLSGINLSAIARHRPRFIASRVRYPRRPTRDRVSFL